MHGAFKVAGVVAFLVGIVTFIAALLSLAYEAHVDANRVVSRTVTFTTVRHNFTTHGLFDMIEVGVELVWISARTQMVVTENTLALRLSDDKNGPNWWDATRIRDDLEAVSCPVRYSQGPNEHGLFTATSCTHTPTDLKTLFIVAGCCLSVSLAVLAALRWPKPTPKKPARPRADEELALSAPSADAAGHAKTDEMQLDLDDDDDGGDQITLADQEALAEMTFRSVAPIETESKA